MRARGKLNAKLFGRKPLFVAATLALVAGAVGTAGPASAAGSADWPGYLFGSDHTSYNAAATSMTPANVVGLEQSWHWAPPASPNSGTNALLATPVEVGGTVYVGAEDGYFFAVDQATQTLKWSAFLGLDTAKGNKPCGPHGQGITGTAAVANDPNTGKPTVYVNSGDGHLYALDAATGSTVWTAVVDTPSTTANDYYSWSSPLVANGKIYVGISSDCDAPLIPGGVESFNQGTGAQTGSWVDVGAGHVGGSIWSTPALLPNGDILVTTGNGYDGQGQPLYNESVVTLDPNTLAVLDNWQVPVSERTSDSDFGGSPTLFTATLSGVPTPMVGACNKNGIYYAWRQSNLAAGPVWEQRITVPYPGGVDECVAAGVWDGTRLIVAGGAPTTINGVTYPGSVQALNPATGAPLWQTGVSGDVLGSPAENGSGLLTATTYTNTVALGTYLLNAATGAQVGFVPSKTALFGQAIFAGTEMIIGGGGTYGLNGYTVYPSGPPVTAVSPTVLGLGTTTTVTLTGSGFTATPKVVISGTLINVLSTTLVSPTQIKVSLHVGKAAATGQRTVMVNEPGPIEDVCANCLTIGTPPPPPAPTSVTPNSFPDASSNVPAVVNGTGFESGATITSHSGITVKVTSVPNSTAIDATVSVSSTLAPGSYNLFVNNPDGFSGECVNCLVVTPPAPVASFSVNCTSLSCNFDGSASTAPGSSITDYAWNFGDASAVAHGVTTSHTFSGSGTYSVTLTVTNASNSTGSTTEQVKVGTTSSGISFVAAAATNGNTATESVTVPTGVTPGNGLLLFATSAVNSPITGPTGWTLVGTASNTAMVSSVWSRVAQSGDAGSTISVGFGGSYHGTVQLLAYSGTNATNPVAAEANLLTRVSTTSATTPTVTASAAGDWLVSYWGAKSSAVTTWTAPGSVIARNLDNGSGSGRMNSLLADSGVPVSPGTVGGVTATTDAAGSAFSTWSIVLAPAP